jgi:hypothetical protein
VVTGFHINQRYDESENQSGTEADGRGADGQCSV